MWWSGGVCVGIEGRCLVASGREPRALSCGVVGSLAAVGSQGGIGVLCVLL
jgi:hypothetical protein